MATLYTTSLRLALPTTGELSGTWGTVVNQSITSMVEQAVTGIANVTTWGVAPDPANTHTLTTANGSTDESRCAVLKLGGSPSAAVEVIAPAVNKVYIINNTLIYDATIKTAAGDGVVIPAGNILTVYCDGTDFFNTVQGLSPTVTVGGKLEGSTTKRAVDVIPEVQSGVTTRATMYRSNPSTEADTFTLTNLEGFRAEQGTFGAGSTITNQFGFVANSDLTGATFNYGYYANLAATAASTITSINGTGATATVETSAPHNLETGDAVFISRVPQQFMTVGSYNGGPFTITKVDSDTFTYNSSATSSQAITSGSAVKANNYNLFTSTGNSYFGGPVINRVNSVLPALSVRQTGTGNSFVIEDSSNDLTPFVINHAGSVIIGSTEQISAVPLNIINASGAEINLGRNDTSVSSGNFIGGFTFYANDNTTTTWNDVALIGVYAAGTHADNDFPTYISLSTTQVAGTGPSERVRIAPNGLTTVGFTATAAGTALSTTAPAVFLSKAVTYTDTQTAGAGTVAHGVFNAFATPTLNSTNVVTYTNASTVYINGAPADGGGQITITNPYALYINAGASYFGGVSTFNGNQLITTTSVGGATSLTIWNKGDSNASTTVQLIAQQAISGSTPRNGGKIVFGRENANAWTTTSNADGFLAFQTVLNNTDTERMRISSVGYVGINETDPETYLHIKTSTTAALVLLESTEAGAAIGPFIDLYRNSASPAAADDLGGFYFYGNDSGAAKSLYGAILAEARTVTAGAEAGDLLFFTTNAGTNSLAMRITSENRLGLGITEPQTLIDMAASNSGLTASNANNTLRFTDTDTTTVANQPLGKIEFFTSDATTSARVCSYILSKAQGTSGGGDLRFATSTNTGNATETMVLSSAGNLTVTGTISATGGYDGNLVVDGDLSLDGITGNIYPIVSKTVQAANAATETFTGIPSWVKKVTVLFDQVFHSTNNQIMIQIGDSGGFETTGYTGGSQLSASPFSSTDVNGKGYPIYLNTASLNYSGALTLFNITGNVWVLSGVLGRSDGFAIMCGGSKTLSGTLTQLRITREPSDTTGVFDGGQFNIIYE